MNFEDDIGIKVSNDGLKRLSVLARRQLEEEARVLDLQERLAEAVAELNRTRTQTLPDLMRELGVEEFKTTDGAKITVKHVVKASIKEENKPSAFSWLRKHGFGSLIKNEIVARFGKGEEKKAEKLFEQLSKKGYEAARSESVHPQTLVAFIKEQIESKKTKIPMEMFGVFQYDESKIKVPEKKE